MTLTRPNRRTAFIAAAAFIVAVLGAVPAGADPVLVAHINDTLTSNDSDFVWVDVYLTNTTDSVAGFEIFLYLDRPDLIEFSDSGGRPEIDTIGTLVSGWGLVQGSFLGGQQNTRIAALATMYPNPPMPSIPPRNEPGLLFRVKMGIFPYTPGTLPDRNATVVINEGLSWTNFANEDGELIGVATYADTTYRYWQCTQWQAEECLNWVEVFTPDEADSTSMEIETRVEFDSTLTHYENGIVRVAPECHGVCGDANGDGQINIGDAVFIINLVFRGGPWPDEDKCADSNGDYAINVGDAIYLVNHIFRGFAPPDCSPHW